MDPSIYQSIHPWIHGSVHPFIHGSIHLSIHSWSHGPIHPSSGVFLYSPVCDLIAPMILFCFFLLLQFPALES
jgi:hypothetical protein